MPRKKREPIELVEENLETLATESENETPENLEEELELVEAEDEEVTTVEAATDEEEETVVEEKPKRKRARRSKKSAPAPEAAAQAEAFVSDSSSEEIPPVEEPAREETPADARPGASPLVTPAFDPGNDPFVRQWEMIRTISESICASLEKASSQIQEMPSQVAVAFQQNFRAPVARPAPITKIAVLAAGLALVISVLSLSFAQAARQSVIAKEAFLQTSPRFRQEEPKAMDLAAVQSERPVAVAPKSQMIARVDPPAARPRPLAVPANTAKKHHAANRIH